MMQNILSNKSNKLNQNLFRYEKYLENVKQIICVGRINVFKAFDNRERIYILNIIFLKAD